MEDCIVWLLWLYHTTDAHTLHLSLDWKRETKHLVCVQQLVLDARLLDLSVLPLKPDP